MGWTVSGNIRGPAGAQGPKGDKGDDGAGIEIAGSVSTFGDLPSGLTPADAGDGYLVEADGKLYIWSGTAFPTDGAGVEFRGPQGPQGPQGEPGLQGIQGAQGLQGAAGPNGAKGDKGDKGDAGADGAHGEDGAPGAPGVRGSQWYFGTGAPGTIEGAMAGDVYCDNSDGMIYQLS